MAQRQYKKDINRGQAEIFPPSLDEYISENNPVRAIDAYVETLDLTELGFGNLQANVNASGQPAYPPSGLLKLYLYGYLNRIRSSRLLERECGRNVEVMWLLEKLAPGYKTIADFRKDNPKALRQTHQKFILLCRQLKLFGGERIAIDGSFFKGNVSAKSFVTTKRLTRDIKLLDASIEEWLTSLDQADLVEPADDALKDDPELTNKLAVLQEKKAQKEAQLQALTQAGKTQQSSVDKDARLLNKRGQKTNGFNVQIATDNKHYLLVADDVTTDANDLEQLHPIARQARDALQVESLEALADAGYYKGAQIQACLNDQITPYVPEPDRKSTNSGRFQRADFMYDPDQNVYRCPAGCSLKPRNPRYQNGQLKQYYASRKADCNHCQIRQQCLAPSSKDRRILRDEHEDVLIEHNQRMASNPGIVRERSAAVEHPFGTLKRRAGWDHFLVRGLEKVRGEWSLMALAYNFTRVLNIIGIEQFMAYCAQQTKRSGSSRSCNSLYLKVINYITVSARSIAFQHEVGVQTYAVDDLQAA
jgi:transposase